MSFPPSTRLREIQGLMGPGTELGPRVAAEVGRMPAPCATCASPTLNEIFLTLRRLTFFRDVHFYLADPADPVDRSYRSGSLGYGPLGSAGWSSGVPSKRPPSPSGLNRAAICTV